MCGRYTLHHRTSELANRFNVAKVSTDLVANYNVAPGQLMPVITAGSGARQLEIMKWGLVPSWSKDPKIGFKLINARDDTIFTKPVWRKLILRQRAMIPADGFYEWQKLASATKKVLKRPYYIHPKQVDLFAFAGVWETWVGADGQELKTYSIITTEPNREMATVHNRMPVILHQSDEAAWLDPELNDRSAIAPFLRPYEDNGLDLYQVSSDVSSPRFNQPSLIYPL